MAGWCNNIWHNLQRVTRLGKDALTGFGLIRKSASTNPVILLWDDVVPPGEIWCGTEENLSRACARVTAGEDRRLVLFEEGVVAHFTANIPSFIAECWNGNTAEIWSVNPRLVTPGRLANIDGKYYKVRECNYSHLYSRLHLTVY